MQVLEKSFYLTPLVAASEIAGDDRSNKLLVIL